MVILLLFVILNPSKIFRLISYMSNPTMMSWFFTDLNMGLENHCTTMAPLDFGKNLSGVMLRLLRLCETCLKHSVCNMVRTSINLGNV